MLVRVWSAFCAQPAHITLCLKRAHNGNHFSNAIIKEHWIVKCSMSLTFVIDSKWHPFGLRHPLYCVPWCWWCAPVQCAPINTIILRCMLPVARMAIDCHRLHSQCDEILFNCYCWRWLSNCIEAICIRNNNSKWRNKYELREKWFLIGLPRK